LTPKKVAVEQAKDPVIFCTGITANMSATVEAPQQYKQPSRKGKKAWRKNVDVSEVQEGLRILREEEIKG
jgi:hypothetical protein